VGLTSGQTPGDCQEVVCNGSGGTASIDDPTDLPAPSSSCESSPSCQGSPATPHFDPAPTGTGCTLAADPGAHVCGDTSNPTTSGKCVECNSDADCLVVNDAGTLTCNVTMGMCQ
jgi:hypothetical protein